MTDNRRLARGVEGASPPDRAPSSRTALRENPSWIAFALEDGTVSITYTVAALPTRCRAKLQLLLTGRPN